MTLVHFVLIFIFLSQVLEVVDSPVNNSVKFGKKSMDKDICPSASKWQMRSESVCPEKPTMYHCLHTKTGNYKYVEICIDPIYVEKGNYPVIFIQERNQAQLSIETCPPTHYQQISQWSNEYKRVGCDDEKSVCDAEGEETCDDRGPTKNRLCRCKYYKGFAADIFIINNDQNKMCYDKKMGGSRCVPFSCPKGEELNAASKCVNVCPSGFYRPQGQLYCVKNDTLTRTSSTTSSTLTATTGRSGKSDYMNENESSAAESQEWIVPVIVLLISLPLIIFVSIFFFCVDKSEDGTKYQIAYEEKSSSLTIRDLKVEDQAEYICTATIQILKCFKAFKKRDSILLHVREDENSGKSKTPPNNNPSTVVHIHKIKHAVIGDRGVISVQEEDDEQVDERTRFLPKKIGSDKEDKSKFPVSTFHRDKNNLEMSVIEPVQKQEESEEPSKPTGEELRKTVPNHMPYKEGHIIYGNELHLRIGCIEINKMPGKEYGTAFRVGSRYVMTAYHVIADTLEHFWKEVYRNLTPEDKNRLNIGPYDTHPVDGEWSLANVIRGLDPKLQEKLLEVGKGMVTDYCTIKFSYFGNEIPENREISHDVPFVSRTHDVAILELKDESPASKNCIALQKTKIRSEQLHVIGHPDGRELQHDPGCRIINNEEELDELKSKGIEFFQEFGLSSDVISDYESCSIDSEKLLFHCSVSTAHGASGSPLIVIPKDKPIVTGMLIHGHPKIFYNYLRNNPKAQQRPECLIESGISMEKVAELLDQHHLTSLSDDIFSA